MQLLYGLYPFPVNGTLLTASVDTVFNRGGQPYSQRRGLHVSGYLTVNGQDDAALQESALRTALAVNFQDLRFLNDDGTPSALALLNAGSITGVNIKNLRFPTTQGPELATVRNFEFDAEAEYPLPGTALLLLSFTETLTFEGGLPIFRHRLAIEGPNQKQLVYPQDTYRATQSGHASGYRAFPNAPPPLWPYALKEAPRFTRTTPERKGPATYQGYGLAWHYEYEDIAPLLGFPNLWPV